MAKDNVQALEGQRYGDLQYNRGHTFWDILHAGTSGQFLQTKGINKAPAWATVNGKIVCYDAIVDASGTYGTHTTIQSALTAVKDTANARILIFGGTYAEALVPSASGSSTHITLEACPPEWNRPWDSVSGPTIGVAIAPSSGIAFDLNATGSINFDLLGIGITGVSGQPAIRMTPAGQVTLRQCRVISSSLTDAAVHVTGSGSGGFLEVLHSYVAGQGTNTVCLYNVASTAIDVYAHESTFVGYIDLNSGGASGYMTATECRFDANGAAQVYSASSIYAEDCIFNCGPTTATGAIALQKLAGSAATYFIHNCQFYSLTAFSAGTAISLTSAGGNFYGTIGGNLFNLSGAGIAWNVGISIGANCHPVIFANQYTTTVTPVSGTADAIATGESAVPVVAHNILSSSHGDTLAGAVVAGDLVYGNSTPKWDRLPKGSNGQVLTMTAGAPAWSATPISAVFYIPFGSQAGIGEAYTH